MKKTPSTLHITFHWVFQNFIEMKNNSYMFAHSCSLYHKQACSHVLIFSTVKVSERVHHKILHTP